MHSKIKNQGVMEKKRRRAKGTGARIHIITTILILILNK